ncbi:hypothetical protein [Roseateles microcysteis]|uniref:hypothetical protein n=1 Tax=Roseateles microcysteis TaxID=3119057 RepID=UPI002FE62A47
MSSEDKVSDLWKSQPLQPMQPVPPAEIQQRASAFQQRIRKRNRREYIAGTLVVPVFLAYAWIFPYWVTKVGALLTVLGTIVVMWQLHRRASSRELPEALGASHVAFHRAELVRQRDAVRDVWLWYIGPIVPGFVVFMWGRQAELNVHHPVAYLIAALLMIAIAVVNRFAARRFQRQIDELDALSSSGH